MCNVASVQYNYFWIITSKTCLKRVVNIFFLNNCSNFIFAASFHWVCVYLCLDFRTQKLSFWPQLARHGNISFILIVTRLFNICSVAQFIINTRSLLKMGIGWITISRKTSWCLLKISKVSVRQKDFCFLLAIEILIILVSTETNFL